jgi:hypothetical protein
VILNREAREVMEPDGKAAKKDFVIRLRVLASARSGFANFVVQFSDATEAI